MREYPQLVYYPRLIYTRLPRQGMNASSPVFARQDLETHIQAIRILAMFFPEIHIPRTHFLTSLSPIQSEIVDELVTHRDFCLLRDLQIINTSVRPDVDGQSDTQRILDRVKTLEWLDSMNAEDISTEIDTLKPKKIDSISESRSNENEYQRLITGLKGQGCSLPILDLLEGVSFRELPFLHERFTANLLKASIDDESLEFIWRTSNSMYFTSSSIPSKDGFAYYDPEMESPQYRFVGNIARSLYSPVRLKRFLSRFLSSDEMVALDSMHLKKLLKFRFDRIGSHFWPDFLGAYYDMATQVAKRSEAWIRIRPNCDIEKLLDVNIERFLAVFKKATLENTVEGVHEIAKEIAELDGLMAKAAAHLSKNVLSVAISQANVWLRHPEIFAGMHALKKICQGRVV